MKKDYIKNLSEKAERRNITHKVEMRQMEGEVNPTISGTASNHEHLIRSEKLYPFNYGPIEPPIGIEPMTY